MSASPSSSRPVACGVDVRRVADERVRPRRRVQVVGGLRLDAAVGEPVLGRQLDGRDRQVELAGELEVALVAARHGHDRPGAVAHQHVVGDPHRDLLAGDRVGRVAAGEHAGLVAALALAVDVVLGGRGGDVGAHLGGLVRVGQPLDGRVLGRQHHERRPEQRVGPGGEHLDRPAVGGEAHRGAVAATDPVALHRLDRVAPLQQVEVVDQPVGVVGDAHHPLAHVALEHREVAAVAAPVGGDLLVGHHRAQARAPVHRRLGDVGQAVQVEHGAPLGRGHRLPVAAAVHAPLRRWRTRPPARRSAGPVPGPCRTRS